MTIRQWPILVALVSLLSLGLSAPSALARNQKPDKAGKSDGQRARPVRRQVIVVDRDGHRRLVQEYFTREGLPPGLAKRESLPPGLQKSLEPIPSALVGLLPPVPPYYSRYLAGRDLVIIDTRTNIVVVLIRDARP